MDVSKGKSSVGKLRKSIPNLSLLHSFAWREGSDSLVFASSFVFYLLGGSVFRRDFVDAYL